MSNQPVISEYEVRKLALEERRLVFDERCEEAARKQALTAHIPAVFAFVTSIASLFLAYQTQRVAARADAGRQQIELHRLRLDEDKQLSERNTKQSEWSLALEQDRRKWNMDLANFVAQNRELIFGSNEDAKTRLSKVMIVAFPRELVLPLFEQLEDVSPSSAWRQGAATAQALAPVGPAQGTVSVYAKFGRGANGRWSEKIFDVEGDPSAVPTPGSVVRARTDVFQRAGFPEAKPGVGLIYKRELGVFREGARARVVSVQIFRDKDYWIEMLPLGS